MSQPMTQREADEALRAECEPLLASAEASFALFAVVEPEVLARLTMASRAGYCSRIAIYRIDGRLKILRQQVAGLVPPTRKKLAHG